MSKSQSTEPLGSCIDHVTNNPKVNIDLLEAGKNTERLPADKNTELLADIKDNEVLNEVEICSLFGEKSMQHVIDQFSPLIKAVFHNLDMCKNWDTDNLAVKLGISKAAMKDMLAGKQTPATMPLFLRILASIY